MSSSHKLVFVEWMVHLGLHAVGLLKPYLPFIYHSSCTTRHGLQTAASKKYFYDGFDDWRTVRHGSIPVASSVAETNPGSFGSNGQRENLGGHTPPFSFYPLAPQTPAPENQTKHSFAPCDWDKTDAGDTSGSQSVSHTGSRANSQAWKKLMDECSSRVMYMVSTCITRVWIPRAVVYRLDSSWSVLHHDGHFGDNNDDMNLVLERRGRVVYRSPYRVGVGREVGQVS
ncbi:hypothetical protein QBC36DRAFT_370666 [Triangularia setosa]|uniref:Uncharacterized protein n=1 Tax=Triangularia setosa TaxID=2587417 RepID=A0AAN7A8B4_9PEZI|nr:hypothetical protein QBC36DRAFT_370666 [Podospora setosa]